MTGRSPALDRFKESLQAAGWYWMEKPHWTGKRAKRLRKDRIMGRNAKRAAKAADKRELEEESTR